MGGDPTTLAEAREALLPHAHLRGYVCPECCGDVCDPCVDALRWALAEIDRLTADLATARAAGRREVLEEAARVCERNGEPLGTYRDDAEREADRLADVLHSLAAKVTP